VLLALVGCHEGRFGRESSPVACPARCVGACVDGGCADAGADAATDAARDAGDGGDPPRGGAGRGGAGADASGSSGTGGAVQEPEQDCEVRGEGTIERPCWIESCEQLQAMAEHPSGVYVLLHDIDCAGFVAGDGNGFLPIGTNEAPFTGTLDGRGHLVLDLVVARPGDVYVGLFAVTLGASLHDFGLERADVLGSEYVAAVVGIAKYRTEIARVYARGTVAGKKILAGVAGGLSDSRIDDCYALVDVKEDATADFPGPSALVAGDVSRDSLVRNVYAQGVLEFEFLQLTVPGRFGEDPVVEASFFDCAYDDYYWHSNCILQSRPIIGPELGVLEHFVFAGWDFTTPVWGERDDRARPCLIWERDCHAYDGGEVALEGHGSEASPFEITTCRQLQAMQLDLDAFYELKNDIDCAGFDFGDGRGFFPVGGPDRPFTGHLDGDHHAITGLRIMRPHLSNVGLFGTVRGASFTSLSIENAVIMGGVYAGVLAGFAIESSAQLCRLDGGLLATPNPVEDDPVGGCAWNVTVTVPE
jgi:mucin-19